MFPVSQANTFHGAEKTFTLTSLNDQDKLQQKASSFSAF